MEGSAFQRCQHALTSLKSTALHRYGMRKSPVFTEIHSRPRFVQFWDLLKKNSLSEPLSIPKWTLVSGDTPEDTTVDTEAGPEMSATLRSRHRGQSRL